VVEASRFASAFTFQYSPRPGTPAAELDNQVPKEAVQERFERLHALQERVSLEEGGALVCTDVEILVADHPGRKDGVAERMSGRARDNRLVHFSVPAGGAVPRPGDLVTVGVTYAAPHHLVADSALDGGTFAVRPTRAGDLFEGIASEGGHAHTHGSHETPGRSGESEPIGAVVLGIPAVRNVGPS
jgi:tRNA-2-methylthio-N6-dimethylallyladenosine synthase